MSLPISQSKIPSMKINWNAVCLFGSNSTSFNYPSYFSWKDFLNTGNFGCGAKKKGNDKKLLSSLIKLCNSLFSLGPFHEITNRFSCIKHIHVHTLSEDWYQSPTFISSHFAPSVSSHQSEEVQGGERVHKSLHPTSLGDNRNVCRSPAGQRNPLRTPLS